jgi:hypothetical protein
VAKKKNFHSRDDEIYKHERRKEKKGQLTDATRLTLSKCVGFLFVYFCLIAFVSFFLFRLLHLSISQTHVHSQQRQNFHLAVFLFSCVRLSLIYGKKNNTLSLLAS